MEEIRYGNDEENSECFTHQIEYYKYNDIIFGIIPSMDEVFVPSERYNLPTVIMSKKKPIFHESYKRKERIKRVFVLTNACNLQCSYCFEGEHTKSEMFNKNEIKNNIKEMFREAEEKNRKIVSFSLFGGEPSINWDAIETAITITKEMEFLTGIRCYKAIVTNGLMSVEQIRYLAKNLDYIYFSFDGPKKLFLQQRKPKGDSQVYDIIFRNAKEVYKENTYLAFKITVTKLTVNYLKEIDDFFSYNFPTCGRLYQPCMVDTNDDLYISFGDFLNKYLELKRYSIFKKNLTTSLYKNKPSDRFCNLMIRNVVYPDGSVLACHRSSMCIREDAVKKAFKVGICDANGVIHRDVEKQKYIKGFKVDNIPECRVCPLKYHCCGGCATIKLLSGDGNMFRKADYCNDFIKFSYSNILSRLLENEKIIVESLPEKVLLPDNRMNEELFRKTMINKIITIEE